MEKSMPASSLSYEVELQDKRIHQQWEAVYRKSTRQNRLNDLLVQRIDDHFNLPPNSSLLDAGCGTGEHTLRWAQRGYRCVGVDVSSVVLERARQRIEASDFTREVELVQHQLENLSLFSDGTFDAVHCRGVLMHVPRWQDALREICRVLRPGGKIVIFENSSRSVEMGLIRLVRAFRSGNSTMTRTAGGFELHTTADGETPLTRYAHPNSLIHELSRNGISVTKKMASAFWDPNRFPEGSLRNLCAAFSSTWVRLRLPSTFCSGIAYLGEKQ